MLRYLKKRMATIEFNHLIVDESDLYFFKDFEGGKYCITFYLERKNVYSVELRIYFDIVDEILKKFNNKLRNLKIGEQEEYSETLRIPVVWFELDFITDTYRNKPLDTVVLLKDDSSIDWFIQLYDYEIEEFFRHYSNLEHARESLTNPLSLYVKHAPHWNSILLKLFFAKRTSNQEYQDQIMKSDMEYEKAGSGVHLNLPVEVYESYKEELASM